jgi:anti-sigma regulatory factor (Ser/Thr protein kinase)
LLAKRRPAVGALVLAVGACWLLGSAWPAAVFLYRGPLIHLLVSYPRGRPSTRMEQGVVALGYLGAVQLIGRTQWVTAGLAVVVTGTVIAGWRRASGADRRARLTSSVVCTGLMAVLGVGAVARLGGAEVDPELLVLFSLLLVASMAVLVADAMWGNWNRSAIASLVIDLGRVEDSGSVRDKLALALGDPALQIAFTGPGGALVDEGGRSVRLTEAGPGRIRTTLRSGGQDIAAIVHDVGALDDPVLRDSVTALTAMAFANARLQADLRSLVTRVTTSRRRILEIADDERRELATELAAGPDAGLDRVQRLLDPAEAGLQLLLEQSRRALADFGRGVYPRTLAAGGLAAACAELARSASVPVHVDIPDIRLPSADELTCYFVCAEALTNATKYAHATAVRMSLAEMGSVVRLVISDDGIGGAGFAEGSAYGTGLRGLVDRLAVIGGTLTVDSPPGAGTTVIAEVPRRPE